MVRAGLHGSNDEILRIPASKPFCWNRPVSRFRGDILPVTQARVPGRLATNGPGCPVKAVRIHLRTAWYLWRYVSGGGQPVPDFNAAGGRATVISPEGEAEEQAGHPADAGPTAARTGPGLDSRRHLASRHGRCAGSLCLYGYLSQNEDTPGRVRSRTPSRAAWRAASRRRRAAFLASDDATCISGIEPDGR